MHLPCTTGTVSTCSPLALHLHHTLQPSTCKFSPDEYFWLLKSVSQVTLHEVSWSSLTNTANERKIATPYWAIHMLTLTYRRQQTTGRARASCAAAIRCRFQLSGSALHIFVKLQLKLCRHYLFPSCVLPERVKEYARTESLDVRL